jgi:hypothetical protein
MIPKLQQAMASTLSTPHPSQHSLVKSSLIVMDNSTDLELWCIIHDESAQRSPFQVTISDSANIDRFKAVIKKTMEPELNQFSPAALILWQVRRL